MHIVPASRISRLLFPDEARICSQARTCWYALRCHIATLVSGLLETHILRCVLLCYPALSLNFGIRMKGL